MVIWFYSEPLKCSICGNPLESWTIGQMEGTHLECEIEKFREEIEKTFKKSLGGELY